MRVGDIVKITGGPLAGCLARLASTTERRVLVVVELQGRQLNIEIDPDWVAATPLERKSATSIEAPGSPRWRKPLA